MPEIIDTLETINTNVWILQILVIFVLLLVAYK